jgi:hypothetical protein
LTKTADTLQLTTSNKEAFMKARKLVMPLILIVVFSAAGAWAQTKSAGLSVDYLDGTVELKSGSSWIALNIGDSVPADATIRVTKGSSIELSRGATTVSFLLPGSYFVADALQKIDKLSPAIGSTLGKIRGVATGLEKKTGTVGGVRGASQSGANAMWIDDLEEVRAQVKDLFAKEKYAEAIPPLEEAMGGDLSVEENEEMSLLLATAHDALGQTAQAWSAVADTAPVASSRYYVDLQMMKARLLLQSMLFTDALSTLNPVLTTAGASGEQIQQGWFLAAVCQRALGDEQAAKKALDTGLALDPSSATGKQIAEIMKSW